MTYELATLISWAFAALMLAVFVADLDALATLTRRMLDAAALACVKLAALTNMQDT